MIHLAAAAFSAASTTATTVAHASKSSGSILDPIAKPIAWVLAEIYSIIPNYALAIMVLSVIWMILISPLTLKSTRSMLAMQKLQPQLKKLQEQHKNDKQAFAQAQMELFREHQVSPFGSCLPMLLPMPVFFALFRVIDGLSHTVKGPDPSIGCTTAVCYDPKYLSIHTKMAQNIVSAKGSLHAFGMDLSHNALSAHGGFLAALPYWIVLLVMAGTSYFQSAQMMNRNKAALANNPQMRMMKYLPLLFVVFCIRFPAGVIIYYAMSNVCRIVQQDAMYRFDPRVKALVAQEVVEVEELTQEFDEQGKGGGGRSGGAAGGPAPKAPSGGPKPKPSGSKPAGRSMFGNLLAAAAEQQKKNTPGGQAGTSNGKGGSNGSNGSARPPSNQAGSNGSARSGGSGASRSGGSGKPGGQARPSGRTNRKRRRR